LIWQEILVYVNKMNQEKQACLEHYQNHYEYEN
jgi:hypothetical protein